MQGYPKNTPPNLTAHPNLANISVSQADIAAYCRCEACEALNHREESPMGSQLTFVNAVAERAEEYFEELRRDV